MRRRRPLWADICQLPPLPGRIGGAGNSRPAAVHPPSPPESVSSDSKGDTSLFVASDWVGRDLVWDTSMPSFVRAARNAARHIPPTLLPLVVPQNDMPVAELLANDVLFPDVDEAHAAPVYTMHLPNVLADPPESGTSRIELPLSAGYFMLHSATIVCFARHSTTHGSAARNPSPSPLSRTRITLFGSSICSESWPLQFRDIDVG